MKPRPKFEPVTPFLKHMMCACGGEFLPTGTAFSCNPPKYEHKCDGCGALSDFGQTHPTIVYIDQALKGEPADKYCVTTADGECISEDPRCMHNRAT